MGPASKGPGKERNNSLQSKKQAVRKPTGNRRGRPPGKSVDDERYEEKAAKGRRKRAA